MNELRALIQEHGKNLGNGILKVDGILNHQINPAFMLRIGKEFAAHFGDTPVDRILTAEISGIGPALMTGLEMNKLVVYARKRKPITMAGPVFMETAPSHTKGGETLLLVSSEFLHPGENILVIDEGLD